ncbi:MAG TPA: hypothetical protein VGM39_00785 [Kofleriaceae bacterium]
MNESDDVDRLAGSNATATAFKIWGALLLFVIVGALLLPGAGRESRTQNTASAQRADVVIR